MDLKELMQTSVDDLAEKQHRHLKQHVLNKLDQISNLIELEEYKKIEDYIKSSPAGDGYGCDNFYIDFNWGKEPEYSLGVDIQEVVNTLTNLKSKQ